MLDQTREAEDRAELRRQRNALYGDPQRSMENLGLLWTGILQDHFQIRLPHMIPSYITSAMMAAFKLGRSVRPFQKNTTEDYTDLRNYLDFSQEDNPHLLVTSDVEKCVLCEASMKDDTAEMNDAVIFRKKRICSVCSQQIYEAKIRNRQREQD